MKENVLYGFCSEKSALAGSTSKTYIYETFWRFYIER